jgi:hypothetical protein
MDLNVSLEDHTMKSLKPLTSLLPEELRSQLSTLLDRPVQAATAPAIPHALLRSISGWARSDQGRGALGSHEPKLNPRDYDMIALLAGTKTSPEKHFPATSGNWNNAEMERRRDISDRKTLTNVINALLSVGGCGVAVWYASGVAGWRNEWVGTSVLRAS